MIILRNIRSNIQRYFKEKLLFILSFLVLPFIRKAIKNAKNYFFIPYKTFEQSLVRKWIRNKYYSSILGKMREKNTNKFCYVQGGYYAHKTTKIKYNKNSQDQYFLKCINKMTILLNEILEKKENYDVIYKIGLVNCLFIDYLSTYYKYCNYFTGLNLSKEMINEYKEVFSSKKKLAFSSGNFMNYILSKELKNKQKDSINIFIYWNLEYFQFLDIKNLLSKLKDNFKNILFPFIEQRNIDLEKEKTIKKRGLNFDLSYNLLFFKKTEFSILWHKLQNVEKATTIQFPIYGEGI